MCTTFYVFNLCKFTVIQFKLPLFPVFTKNIFILYSPLRIFKFGLLLVYQYFQC